MDIWYELVFFNDPTSLKIKELDFVKINLISTAQLDWENIEDYLKRKGKPLIN